MDSRESLPVMVNEWRDDSTPPVPKKVVVTCASCGGPWEPCHRDYVRLAEAAKDLLRRMDFNQSLKRAVTRLQEQLEVYDHADQ